MIFKYALFAGEKYHNLGGWLDIQCISDSIEILKQTCDELLIDDGWAHIVDLEKAQAVTDGVKDLTKPKPKWEWKTAEDEQANETKS